MTSEILDVLDKVGSGCGLLALPYLIFQNLRSRPRFSFDFRCSNGCHIQKDDLHQYRYQVSGILKNRSLDPTAITKIHLMAWANKNKTSSYRSGCGGVSVVHSTSAQILPLPLQFAPREAKSLDVIFEFPVLGTSDEKILSEHIPVIPGSTVLRQKYDYEICFEDISENIFDQSGRQICNEEIQLRWTLPNTVRQFQDGHIWPFLAHYARILQAKFKFRIRLLFQALGLWK